VAEIKSRTRAFSPVKGASTRFQAPLGGPDRGVAWPLVRVSPCPSQPLGERDVSLGGGPKPHLACAPKGRRTLLPLGALRVCSRPLPRLIPGGSRHQRRGGFPQRECGRGAGRAQTQSSCAAHAVLASLLAEQTGRCALAQPAPSPAPAGRVSPSRKESAGSWPPCRRRGSRSDSHTFCRRRWPELRVVADRRG